MSNSNSQILSEIKKLGQQIKKLDQRVINLEQRLENVEKKFNDNLIKFKDEILGKMENMQTDITLLSSDKDELEDHEERIIKLETKSFPA